MIGPLCDLLVGVALMCSVFGAAGMVLWVGSLAVAVVGMAVDDALRRLR